MFSEKLKTYRNELGLTQDEFAKRSGISRAIISMIEAGTRPPSKSFLEKLSIYSEKSIDWWYGKEDKERSWGDLNPADNFLDYIINNDRLDENGKMDEESFKYFMTLVDKAMEIKKSRLEQEKA